MGRPEVLVRNAGTLCESPYWDTRTELLFWVDIPAGTVQCATDSGTLAGHWDLGEPVSAISRRDRGGWLAALERRVVRYDDNWSVDGPAITIEDQSPDARFNDGAADSGGHFWVGTKSKTGLPGACALYRIDPAGLTTTVLTGVTTSNGLGWSPDGHSLYWVDTGIGRIDRLTVDPDDDQLLGREPFVEIARSVGRPDGLAVDTDGCVWVALWGAGLVHRYTPDGRLDREIAVPASLVSNVVFGKGTLLITTAAGEPDDRTEPLAGTIFICDAGIDGVPVGEFSG